MRVSALGSRARAAFMGAAVVAGAGALIAGGLVVGGPAAGAVTTTALAGVAPAGSGPSTAATRGCTMAGAIEGSQASPVIHSKDHVLVGLPGYYPQRDAATTEGASGHSGAGSGGLLPIGSGPGAHPASSGSSGSGSGTGRRAAVMAGAIEGSQASPVIHSKDHVLVGLPGYYPQRDAASTEGASGHSGAGSGGLLPIGSGPGAHPASSGSSGSGTGPAAPRHCG